MTYEDIQELMKTRPTEALDIINKEIELIKPHLYDEKEYKKYKKFLSLRVSACTVLGKTDEIISTIAWKDRHPYETNIDFGNNNSVTLYEKSAFLIETDAYVNAIHKTKFFSYSNKSFSHALKERSDEKYLEQQINRSQDKSFIRLEHKHLPAQESFHLPILEYEDTIDVVQLRKSLQELFQYFIQHEISSFTFVALGAAHIKDVELFDESIKIIAEEINRLFSDKPSNFFPQISFSFLNFESLVRYEKILNTETMFGKISQEMKQKYNNRFHSILKIAKTKNDFYKNQLYKLNFYIDENTSILLLGETGVGKSYIAKEIIHKNSNRQYDKFAQVNCGGLTSTLLHSELWGAAKGSFTDAKKDIVGIIEYANGGTVFLDEIGSADMETQLHLMTYLDKGAFRRLGERNERYSDVRLIFATDINLKKLIAEGKFKKQLYERISNDRIIQIPSIRERTEDIEYITLEILEKLNRNLHNKAEIGIAKAALEKIRNEYLWPGNYRQLEKTIHKWYKDAEIYKKNKIDSKIIQADPPRNTFFTENNLGLFEVLLEHYIRQRDWNDENVLDAFIKPILAKVFLENLKDKYPPSKSNQVIGLGSKRTDGTLYPKYEIYNKKIRNKVD